MILRKISCHDGPLGLVELKELIRGMILSGASGVSLKTEMSAFINGAYESLGFVEKGGTDGRRLQFVRQ